MSWTQKAVFVSRRDSRPRCTNTSANSASTGKLASWTMPSAIADKPIAAGPISAALIMVPARLMPLEPAASTASQAAAEASLPRDVAVKPVDPLKGEGTECG